MTDVRRNDPHLATPVDFLINYEHKAREIESVGLIRNELERRGYTVGLANTYHPRWIDFTDRRDAAVVVTPALYNDGVLFAFVYRIAGACRKVVNLQWEQALTNQDESDPAFYQNPKGKAREAVHLCWGEEPRQRLLRAGVPPERAVVVGPVQMDALRPEMRSLHASREAVAERFSLDPNREWVLFISSFTFVNMTSEEFETEVRCVGDWLRDFRRLSTQSQDAILSWMLTACERYPDRIFIYRPHPSETADPRLVALAREHENFRVIGDMSIRQWIISSDRILTWYSTSAAEVFVAGKTCSVLRPVPIPEAIDVSIMKNAVTVETLEQFLECLAEPKSHFALDADLIRRYFAVDEATPAFMKVCDLLEEVRTTSKHDMPPIGALEAAGYYLSWVRHRLFFLAKERIRHGLPWLVRSIPWLRRRIENHEAVLQRMDNDREKNLASLAELDRLERTIAAIRDDHGRTAAPVESCLSSS